MPPKAHARCGGSVLHRRIACTASLYAEETHDDDGTSPAAIEGTRAHNLFEWCNENNADTCDYRILENDDPVVDDKGEIEDVMLTRVQTCLDIIREFVPPDKRDGIIAELGVRFDTYVPDPEGAWGTADVVWFDDETGTLYVWDLKYGFIPVSTYESAQLRIMALGVISTLGDILPTIKKVHLSILQPKLGDFNHEVITPKELQDWAKKSVTPQILIALDKDKATFNPGESQCQFCRARLVCKARTEWFDEVALEGFGDIGEPLVLQDQDYYTEEQLEDFVDKVDDMVKWCHSIKEHVKKRAIAGHANVDGWMLTQSSGRRQLKNDVDLHVLAKDLGLKYGQLMNEKIKSPNQIEQLLPTRKRAPELHKVLKASVYQPAGAIQFVKRKPGTRQKEYDPSEGFTSMQDKSEPVTDTDDDNVDAFFL